MQSYLKFSEQSTADARHMLEGQRHAESWLFILKSICGTGDELFMTLESLIETGDRAKLRGFCRAVQKKLEAR